MAKQTASTPKASQSPEAMLRQKLGLEQLVDDGNPREMFEGLAEEIYKKKDWKRVIRKAKILLLPKENPLLNKYILETLQKDWMGPIKWALKGSFITYVVYHYAHLGETEQKQVLENIKEVLAAAKPTPSAVEPKPALATTQLQKDSTAAQPQPTPKLPDSPKEGATPYEKNSKELEALRREVELFKARLSERTGEVILLKKRLLIEGEAYEALLGVKRNLEGGKEALKETNRGLQKDLEGASTELEEARKLAETREAQIKELSQELARARQERGHEIAVRGAEQKKHLQIKGEEVKRLAQSVIQLTEQLEASRADYLEQLERAVELQQLVESSEGKIKRLEGNLAKLQEKNTDLSGKVVQQNQKNAQLQKMLQERNQDSAHRQREQLKQEVNTFIKELCNPKGKPTHAQLKKGTQSFLRAVHEFKGGVKQGGDWRMTVLSTLLGCPQTASSKETRLMKKTIQQVQAMNANQLEQKLEKFTERLLTLRDLVKTTGISLESAQEVVKQLKVQTPPPEPGGQPPEPGLG